MRYKKPAFLTGCRRESAEMSVGEPDKDECPVDARPGEREIHGVMSRSAKRSRVSQKWITVQWVSRNKASVRWTLVPANAQATEGLGRCPSAAGSAQPQGLVPASARARRARAGTQAQQGARSAGAERSKDFFSILLVLMLV